MTETSAYDAIIIGGGMGGLTTGAILAKKEGMKVLVLEREVETGGRMMCFGGPYGEFSDKEYRALLGRATGSWVIDAYPSLPEAVDMGLFRDHILEAGWHGVSGGDRARFTVIARSLGKQIPMANLAGFLYWHDERWVELREYFKTWPAESNHERKRVAAERAAMSRAEAMEFMHVGLRDYLGSITPDKLVLEFYAALGRWQMCINDDNKISAGDWILTNNMTSGSGGFGVGEVIGGTRRIAEVFGQIITECGGEIITSAPVSEVLISGHAAVGVRAEIGGATRDIYADNIISNLQMNQIFRIMPESLFPAELVNRVKTYEAVGGLLMTIKTTEPLETAYPKGIYFTGRLPGVELDGGNPPWGFEQVSAVDPSRIINGDGCLTHTYMCIKTKNPDEIHNKALMAQAHQAQLDFLRRQWPQFDDILQWYVATAVDSMFGCSSMPGMVGDRRPGVKHPYIKGLFFTGDTVTQWDVGTNGTAHGAVICASAVTGRDYVKTLPEYMR